MSILDKLIGMGFGDDLTETTWWTDTVFRELSRTERDLPVAGTEDASEAAQASESL